MADEQKLTVLGHLQDLRTRLVRVAIAVVIGTVVSFVFRKDIVDVLKSIAEDAENLQIIGTTEGIVVAFQLSITCGFFLATPVILYEIVMFIRPALNTRERKYLYALLPGVVVAFASGAVFAYFILLPPALGFLYDFSSDLGVVQWRLNEYISTVTRLLFGIGLCFELPLVIYFLSKIGILKVHQLTRFRRWAIVLAFLLAAFITPTPDPINQTLVAVPLIVLYEIGILLARIAHRGKKSKDAVPNGTFKK